MATACHAQQTPSSAADVASDAANAYETMEGLLSSEQGPRHRLALHRNRLVSVDGVGGDQEELNVEVNDGVRDLKELSKQEKKKKLLSRKKDDDKPDEPKLTKEEKKALANGKDNDGNSKNDAATEEVKTKSNNPNSEEYINMSKEEKKEYLKQQQQQGNGDGINAMEVKLTKKEKKELIKEHGKKDWMDYLEENCVCDDGGRHLEEEEGDEYYYDEDDDDDDTGFALDEEAVENGRSSHRSLTSAAASFLALNKKAPQSEPAQHLELEQIMTPAKGALETRAAGGKSGKAGGGGRGGGKKKTGGKSGKVGKGGKGKKTGSKSGKASSKSSGGKSCKCPVDDPTLVSACVLRFV